MPVETRLVRETVTWLKGPYTFKVETAADHHIIISRFSAGATGYYVRCLDSTSTFVAGISSSADGISTVQAVFFADITGTKGYIDTSQTGISIQITEQVATNVCFVIVGASGQSGPLMRLTTIATNDDPTDDVIQAVVTTTDATVTTLATIAITASRTYMIEAFVRARRTGGAAGTADDGAVYIRRAMVTTKAGTVTINAVQDGLTQEDQAAWDCTFTVSGANVLVRITGAAANNVTWHGTIVTRYLGT